MEVCVPSNTSSAPGEPGQRITAVGGDDRIIRLLEVFEEHYRLTPLLFRFIVTVAVT
jgi:hypothetical protein